MTEEEMFQSIIEQCMKPICEEKKETEENGAEQVSIEELIEIKLKMEVTHDRKMIASALTSLLKSLNQKTNVENIEYLPEKEMMMIKRPSGSECLVSVWGDAPAGVIREIMNFI